MKKFLAMILALCSMFSIASAASISESDGSLSTDIKDVPTPYYQHIAVIVTSLDISKAGYATASGATSLDPGYNAKVLLELQEFDNGWRTIDSYSDSGSGPRGVKLHLQRFVPHGTYRAKMTITVTDSNGNYVETETATSYVERY